MVFRTVFDATQNGHAWWWLAVPLVFVVLVAALIVMVKRVPPPWGPGGRARTVSDWLGLGVIMLIPLFGLTRTFTNYREAATKLREGAVVEGRVTDFSELPSSGLGQKAESFVVDGRRFTYSGYDVTSAVFHQMASQGGPIHEGLYVRVTYSGADILRLEIAQ